jgi:hypothetical protein
MSGLVILDPGTEKRQRIAWDNLLTHDDATITFSSETAGYEADRAYDWLECDAWKASASGDSWIMAVFSLPQAVNYFAFHATTLFTNGATIALQYSLDAGVTWMTASTATPTHNGAHYLCFDSILAPQWRVLVTSTPASEIGVVSFGTDFMLELGQWVGLVPPQWGRDTVVSNTIANNGAMIGRSIMRNGAKSALSLEWITQAFIETYWMPFLIAAETHAFFYLWDKINHPDQAAFCATDGKITPPSLSQSKFAKASLSFICKAAP